MLWDHRRICGPSLTETSLCPIDVEAVQLDVLVTGRRRLSRSVRCYKTHDFQSTVLHILAVNGDMFSA
jgi:hypothetical protein